MKKLLFSLNLFVLMISATQAQIILNQSNTAYNPGVMNAVTMDTTAFVIPVAGTNLYWDYSSVAHSSVTSWSYITPSNPDFSNATYADTNLSSTLIPGRYYYFDAYYETSAAGSNYLGFVVNEQRYGIGALTGNSNDSCIFPQQHYNYSGPYYIMQFPATMSSAWSAEQRSFVDFQLTISAYSLSHTPCKKVSNTIRKDTVIGWGKLRVPTASGASYAYDVLMIKRMVVVKDSFYMNGTPAPGALLTAFGLSQGQTTVSNRYVFWRENARYSLLLINFGPNNFTKASSAYYDETAQYDPSSVAEFDPSPDIVIFPNPNDGEFNILSEQFKNEICQLRIFDIAGRLVDNKSVAPTGIDRFHFKGKTLNAGTYFIELTSDSKRLTKKLIVK